jgi:hypothetical protein
VIVIDNVLVGDDIVEKQFVCDLAKCKGGCCEDGDAGAPLEDEELTTIAEAYEAVKPYLSPASLAEIDKKGNMFFMKSLAGLRQPWVAIPKYVCMEFVKKTE